MRGYPPIWQPDEPPHSWEDGGRERFAHICYEGAVNPYSPIEERRFWGKILRTILPECETAYLPKRDGKQ